MAIVCTSMFYLTFSLHKHGRPVGFIFRCRFAATPKNENDRRRSVLFLGVAARGRPPTLDPLLCTPYFAPPTLHPLLCTKTTAVLLLLLSFAFKNQAVQSIACKA